MSHVKELTISVIIQKCHCAKLNFKQSLSMCGFLLQPKQSTQQLRVCFSWETKLLCWEQCCFSLSTSTESSSAPFVLAGGLCICTWPHHSHLHQQTTPGPVCARRWSQNHNHTNSLLCYCVTFRVWMASSHLCFLSLYIPASLLYFCRRSFFNVAMIQACSYHKQTQPPHGNSTGCCH